MQNPTGNENPGTGGTRSRDPSTMAGKVALIRVCESGKPRDERICYDPYAIRFLDPATQSLLIKNPGLSKHIMAQVEHLLPGIGGCIVARVRYFDDVIRQAAATGFEQIVILGAGYDTRAYRIEELGSVRVFEVDHPDTIGVKMEKIKEIFGSLPGHVAYIPADLETDDPGRRLAEYGYDPLKKTLFAMEGLIMYLPPASVDGLLSFIVHNSGRGSAVIFDYCPSDNGDGEGPGWETGRKASDFVMQQGEPLKFSIDGPVEEFLVQRGFCRAGNVASADLRRDYFHGKNADRAICGIYAIAYATIEDGHGI